MDKRRLKKLQAALRHPLLIKKKENLFYLTGRFFMHGYLLVLPKAKRFRYGAGKKKNGVVFFGDGLESPPAGGEGIKFDRFKNLPLHLTKAHNLLLEDEFTFAEYNYIRRKIKDLRFKIKAEHVKSPVDFERQIKDAAEIQKIKKSMQIVAQVFKLVKKQLKKKKLTEIQLANFIKAAGLKLGAEDISFPPIVASGINAAVPHHVPGNKKLKAGESIIIDFGFKYKNYCSDFTRTVFLGFAPKKLTEAYNQVELAYKKSIQAAKAGAPAKKLFKTALETLAEKKLDKYFIHSLGHGTGLEIHELPNLSPVSKDILKPNMVFSVEPGVYIPKIGGIRIEDLVYLTHKRVKKFINIPTKLEDNIIV